MSSSEIVLTVIAVLWFFAGYMLMGHALNKGWRSLDNKQADKVAAEGVSDVVDNS